MAQFSHTSDELNFIVVDRVTSIRILAPERPAELNDWNAYATMIWTVRVCMGADQIDRHFYPRWYLDDGSAFDPYQAYHMAREDAIVFARELTHQINELKEIPR